MPARAKPRLYPKSQHRQYHSLRFSLRRQVIKRKNHMYFRITLTLTMFPYNTMNASYKL